MKALCCFAREKSQCKPRKRDSRLESSDRYRAALEHSHVSSKPSGFPQLLRAHFVSFGREVVQRDSNDAGTAAVEGSSPATTTQGAAGSAAASATPHHSVMETEGRAYVEEIAEPSGKNFLLRGLKPRRPSTTVLYFNDFSKCRIEAHYKSCHPKRWNSFLEKTRESGGSRQLNLEFFSREKISGSLCETQLAWVEPYITDTWQV